MHIVYPTNVLQLSLDDVEITVKAIIIRENVAIVEIIIYCKSIHVPYGKKSSQTCQFLLPIMDYPTPKGKDNLNDM